MKVFALFISLFSTLSWGAFSPAQIKDLNISMGPEHLETRWNQLEISFQGLQLKMKNQELLPLKTQDKITLETSDYELMYQIPLMLQSWTQVELAQLQHQAQVNSFQLSFDRLFWIQNKIEGELKNFSLNSLHAKEEVSKLSTTELLLKNSTGRASHFKIPLGLEIPVPGKPRPISLGEIQSLQFSGQNSQLEIQGKIPGLIPLWAQMKMTYLPENESQIAALDIKSFTLGGIELKGVLLLQLKKYESDMLKIRGTTIVFLKKGKGVGATSKSPII